MQEGIMVKDKQRPPLSEAQLEIMNVVWDRGEVTVTGVWQVLSKRRAIARNTVQTMMMRLEEKGWLSHHAEGNRFLYSAVPERTSILKKMVTRLVDTAFGGSAEDMVMALLDGRGVSPEEAARIRKMIRKAQEEES
jgi:predicted transcriptional regulator